MSEPEWQSATVLHVEPSAKHMITLRVQPAQPKPHIAGQHYELRVHGDDESRKYSVMSSPSAPTMLEFGIRPYAAGAVSPRLQSLRPGDQLDIRGPFGTSFLWQPDMIGPLVLLGGGSGVTPLVSMHRHFRELYPNGTVVFVVSAQSPDHVLPHIQHSQDAVLRFTDTQGVIDRPYLQQTIGAHVAHPNVRCFVCGPIGFIDSMVDYLLELGFPPNRVVSEKFR